MSNTMKSLPLALVLAALGAMPASATVESHPRSGWFVLGAGETKTLGLRFAAGPAMVHLDCGYPDDMDIRVYDEWGNLIAEHRGDPGVIHWTAYRAGKYFVEITNLGPTALVRYHAS